MPNKISRHCNMSLNFVKNNLYHFVAGVILCLSCIYYYMTCVKDQGKYDFSIHDPLKSRSNRAQAENHNFKEWFLMCLKQLTFHARLILWNNSLTYLIVWRKKRRRKKKKHWIVPLELCNATPRVSYSWNVFWAAI